MRPKSPGSREPPNADSDGSEGHEGQQGRGAVLEILGHAPVPAEPGEGPLDDPTSLDHLEADRADVKALNPPRTLMVTAANTVAVICFAAAGAVDWSAALPVAAGAFLGGYGGAHLGRRLPAGTVRAGTVALACLLTALFFARGYG